ncbi:hypothetical protein PQD13_gp84 [Gordonia phage Clawz]|uniref:Uncharacterized protein n=1 Tax=Gordonia phage Clawz TaxID=2743910 RepID=A0AAE7F850_9CAUD|nr:hypothetical protein PQD13_gp84 [Gordonia phage Clawz]QKY79996.1 hypothetical protein SEA_CLAWZ_84 [Gordonia phage Clawz]
MSDEMKAEVITQYALQSPNGRWVTNPNPESRGELSLDPEKAYAFSDSAAAEVSRRTYSEHLRQKGGTGMFRLMRREVTVLRPMYECVDVVAAIPEEEF